MINHNQFNILNSIKQGKTKAKEYTPKEKNTLWGLWDQKLCKHDHRGGFELSEQGLIELEQFNPNLNPIIKPLKTQSKYYLTDKEKEFLNLEICRAGFFAAKLKISMGAFYNKRAGKTALYQSEYVKLQEIKDQLIELINSNELRFEKWFVTTVFAKYAKIPQHIAKNHCKNSPLSGENYKKAAIANKKLIELLTN